MFELNDSTRQMFNIMNKCSHGKFRTIQIGANEDLKEHILQSATQSMS